MGIETFEMKALKEKEAKLERKRMGKKEQTEKKERNRVAKKQRVAQYGYEEGETVYCLYIGNGSKDKEWMGKWYPATITDAKDMYPLSDNPIELRWNDQADNPKTRNNRFWKPQDYIKPLEDPQILQARQRSPSRCEGRMALS